MIIRFDIQKRLGAFNLDARGEFMSGLTGIFGPSGSGKTTLLKCLCGFLTPDRGEVAVDGDVHFSDSRHINLPFHRRGVGMVFQEPLLFPHMPVKANILYGRHPAITKQYIDQVAGLLSLGPIWDRYPAQLSAGQQKRAALGRALVHRPRLLLMDEPVESLDLKSRMQIIHDLKKVHAEFKVPVIFVSHSISELLAFVDQVLLVEQGKAAGYGSPVELLLQRPLPVLEQEILENVYELPVQSRDAFNGSVVLSWGGVPLVVPYPGDEIRPWLRVGIRANDIIVATDPVRNISARNCVAARLMNVTLNENRVRLLCRVGESDCFVEITRAALDALKLAVGQTVYLIIKAAAVERLL